jgi:hypothetical protein
VNVFSVNRAVTVFAAVTVTVQMLPETESHPLQLVKFDPVAGVAVSVTTVPTSYTTAHVEPQLIWEGFAGLDVEVTVPLPLPAFLAVKVAFTLKLVALVAVPAGVVTLIGPVVAPAGTVARSELSETTVKLAPTALKVTAVAPVKFVPLIVTLAPTAPLVGVKLVIVGGFMTVKTPVLVAVPSGVVTLNGPLVAPAGTVA